MRRPNNQTVTRRIEIRLWPFLIQFSRQPIAVVSFGVTLLIHGLMLEWYNSITAGAAAAIGYSFQISLALNIVITLGKHLTTRRWLFNVLLAANYLSTFSIVTTLPPLRIEHIPLLMSTIFDTMIYLTPHLGALFALPFAVAPLLTPSIAAGVPVWITRPGLINFLTLALFVFICAVFQHYRELLVDREKEVARLDSAILQLSRANMSYQEYALDVEERSTESERQRITRDIHDLVGYALTNSIVTMEAAVDMIRVDPLRVPALLQSARDNAEEGLLKVRQSLYLLRAKKTAFPTGVAAIRRMVRNFERATSVDVELDIAGQPPLDLGEIAGQAVHHFVQEALINSFRHGRADKILVVLYWDTSNLKVSVWDNGSSGGQAIKEGIGISGMRERVQAVDGTVSYESAIDGFNIAMSIPRSRLV